MHMQTWLSHDWLGQDWLFWTVGTTNFHVQYNKDDD